MTGGPILRRVVTALSVAAGLVCLFLYAPVGVLLAILIAVSCMAQLEFYQLARAYGPVEWAGMAAGAAWLGAVCLSGGGMSLAVPMLAAVMFAIFLAVIFDGGRTRPLASAAVTLAGFLYVPFLFSFFAAFMLAGASRDGVMALFALLATVKASDMGGYAFGMAFGKHKMCPSISPKKSWEGMAGSVLGSALVALLFAWIAKRCGWGRVLWDWGFLSYWQAAVAGGVLAVAGTLGDLVESRIKREFGVKDSATFMPAGMGGFLDMCDSVLFIPALVAAVCAILSF